MARKTVNVSDVRKTVNDMLAHVYENDDPGSAEVRSIGLCVLIETVLMETGNYKGFSTPHTLRDVCPTPCRGRRYY